MGTSIADGLPNTQNVNRSVPLVFLITLRLLEGCLLGAENSVVFKACKAAFDPYR